MVNNKDDDDHHDHDHDDDDDDDTYALVHPAIPPYGIGNSQWEAGVRVAWNRG